MAALLGMCCCHGWLGTSLLPFWDKNKPPSGAFSFSLLLYLSPPLLMPAIPPHPERQRQTETHQGTSTLPTACPDSDKDTAAPPREPERGRQRDGVKKAREEWQRSEGEQSERAYERGGTKKRAMERS